MSARQVADKVTLFDRYGQPVVTTDRSLWEWLDEKGYLDRWLASSAYA